MKLFSKCLATGLCLSALAGLPACGNDDDWKDVDGAAPQFELKTEHERTELGRTIKIAGKVSDNDGISTIDLVCHDLNLNKRINLIEIYGEPLKEYDLDYQLKIQENQAGEDFSIDVVITDIGGRQERRQMRVTLDADYTAPQFTVALGEEMTVLIKDKTTLNLKFSVADNRVVDYVTIDLKDISAGEANATDVEGFPRRVEGGAKTLDFAERIALPAKAATLLATVTAYDREANEPAHSVTSVSRITVSELLDFDKVYLADVATAEELNSDIFGVPVLMDHTGPFEYEVRYYNEKAGTEICFLPQKTDFNPICFAPSKDNASVLGDDPEQINKLKLDKAETYYHFKINTKTGAYSFDTYSIAEAIDPVMHMHYGQDDLNTWWETNPDKDGDIWWQKFYFGPMSDGPRDVIEMTQDSKNKHLFILEDWKVDAGELRFVIHNWHHDGWWNFTAWRVDDSADPGKFMYYGNFIPATSHYESNQDYFDWKYADTPGFDLSKWGDESYRKQFVPDNWVNMNVERGGTYKLIFDAHTERARLVPQN